MKGRRFKKVFIGKNIRKSRCREEVWKKRFRKEDLKKEMKGRRFGKVNEGKKIWKNECRKEDLEK